MEQAYCAVERLPAMVRWLGTPGNGGIIACVDNGQVATDEQIGLDRSVWEAA